MKTAFNFLVCKAYHYSRTQPLYQTIGQDIKNSFSDIYFFGGFESIDNIPIIKSSDTDDYLSCIPKLFNVFKYHQNTNYDWYFIGDDDTFINMINLNKLIQKISYSSLAIYGYADWAETVNSNFPNKVLHTHGGSGTLMNQKTFKTITKFLFETDFKVLHYMFSDVTLGMNVYQYNSQNPNKQINFVNVKEMLSPHIDLKTIDVNKIITIHTKDRVSFFNLHKLLTNQIVDNL